VGEPTCVGAKLQEAETHVGCGHELPPELADLAACLLRTDVLVPVCLATAEDDDGTEGATGGRDVIAKVTVCEDLSGKWRFGVGGSVWGSAALMVAFCGDRDFFPAGWWRQRKVLELGAGTGYGV